MKHTSLCQTYKFEDISDKEDLQRDLKLEGLGKTAQKEDLNSMIYALAHLSLTAQFSRISY